MGSVNKLILLGNLGADPEVKTTQNGGKIVNLRVATSDVWKDREGQRQEKTEWHAVTIFNERLADFAEQYLTKGSQVYIEGKSRTRKWQDQAGNDRFSTECVLEKYDGVITLVGSKPDNGRDNDRQRNDDRQDNRGTDNRRNEGGRDDARRETRISNPRDGARDGRGSMRDDLDDDIPF